MRSGVAPWRGRPHSLPQRTSTASPDINSIETATLQVSVPRSGLPECAERAKDKIQAVVASAMINETCDRNDDFARNGTVAGSGEISSEIGSAAERWHPTSSVLHPTSSRLSLLLPSIGEQAAQRARFEDLAGGYLGFGQAFNHLNGISIQGGNSSKQTDIQTSGSLMENTCGGIHSASSSSPSPVCLMCKKKPIEAALVPCGDYRFCNGCANTAAVKYEQCPYCKENAFMAVTIKI